MIFQSKTLCLSRKQRKNIDKRMEILFSSQPEESQSLGKNFLQVGLLFSTLNYEFIVPFGISAPALYPNKSFISQVMIQGSIVQLLVLVCLHKKCCCFCFYLFYLFIF